MEIIDLLDYDSMGELTYYGYCLKESLRIEPPVTYSSPVVLTEDVDFGKCKIRKNDMIMIGMYRV